MGKDDGPAAGATHSGRHGFFWKAFPSVFGEVGIVWSLREGIPLVARILTPRPGRTAQGRVRESFPDARPGRDPCIDGMSARIGAFLSGEDVLLPGEGLDWGRCGEFQRHVLALCRRIPRGGTATYGGIALTLGTPGASRAVGTALARNPFPLIVPCHRVVRSGGHLGGFGGGAAMKKALLEMEGVRFDPGSRVRPAHIRTPMP